MTGNATQASPEQDPARKRVRVRSKPQRPMTAKQAAHNSSPQNVARLRENLKAARADGRKITRAGVPDGWKGKTRRKRLGEVRAMAAQKAGAVVQRLQQAGLVPTAPEMFDAKGNINKDAAAIAALTFCVSIILAVDPETGQSACTLSDRLEAARTFLAYTLPPMKDLTRREAKIGQAERCLSLILAGS